MRRSLACWGFFLKKQHRLQKCDFYVGTFGTLILIQLSPCNHDHKWIIELKPWFCLPMRCVKPWNTPSVWHWCKSKMGVTQNNSALLLSSPFFWARYRHSYSFFQRLPNVLIIVIVTVSILFLKHFYLTRINHIPLTFQPILQIKFSIILQIMRVSILYHSFVTVCHSTIFLTIPAVYDRAHSIAKQAGTAKYIKFHFHALPLPLFSGRSHSSSYR